MSKRIIDLTKDDPNDTIPGTDRKRPVVWEFQTGIIRYETDEELERDKHYAELYPHLFRNNK